MMRVEEYAVTVELEGVDIELAVTFFEDQVDTIQSAHALGERRVIAGVSRRERVDISPLVEFINDRLVALVHQQLDTRKAA
ncbi:hypothetical protein [Silvimonas soli]|uniref:hypothetical protein n=1 Tax=Silvimonas soli TaxID=2980100 RepID=UPI0024B33D31|nr:hypothetical protein [Silvimonas soli]